MVGVAARAKHFLRRYTVLQQRIRGQQCQVFKIDDPNMPADFLTKWLPRTIPEFRTECSKQASNYKL